MLFRSVCDGYLVDVIALLEPTYVIGVGKYAYQKLLNVAPRIGEVVIADVLHPSPASPLANRGWAAQAEEKLTSLGIW